MHVLIVEDNSNMRKMMRSTFEHHKCSVIEAADGVEGLELAALHKPDIIISDALMPRMDGFQFLRALKADERLKSIPFLFYSAIYDGDQEEKLALSLGAEAFINKPAQPEELWDRICAIMKTNGSGNSPALEPAVAGGETQYLNEYCQIVASKLEEKVHELEEALLLRKEAEDRLQRLNTELELRVAREVEKNIEQDRIMAHQARLAAMGEMLSNISHQWRQPLNNVALIIQNLQSEFEDSDLSVDACREYVSECMKYLTYMSGTINNFQAFYLPDHKQQSFSPGKAIRDVVAMIADDMKFHGIALKEETEEDVQIYGYRKEFAQVIMNIIMNAKDSLQQRHPGDPYIEIRCLQADDTAIISIRDNGCGIPPDIIDKIFDPYFTTKFMAQGIGMGLFMSKMIIEKHMGGTITVNNTGEGAEVIIRIPAISDQA